MVAVRFALVGYGFGGRYFHAPFLASAANCEFVGVMTRSAERRALVHSEHPGAHVFDSLDDLVSRGIEAVAISTPADTHSQLTDEALRRGLHVVCDKPFALDGAAAEHSVGLAASLGKRLSSYQNRRWDSDFLTAYQVVQSGKLGSIIRFESRFERFAPERGPGRSGGGTLLDFGSHLVDQAIVLLGTVETVYAEYRVRDSGLDDDVFLSLTHRSGAKSHLFGSWSQGAPGPRFRVIGTKATFVVDALMDGQEAAVVSGRSPGTTGDSWGIEPPERWGKISQGEVQSPVPSLPGAWNTFYPAFASAVLGEGDVPVAPEDAVATARILDAARRSAATGSVERIDTYNVDAPKSY
jgi:predicted dehydrogenase